MTLPSKSKILPGSVRSYEQTDQMEVFIPASSSSVTGLAVSVKFHCDGLLVYRVKLIHGE